MDSFDSRRPVFVLCCSRSGSTLLRYILDTHPRMCCPPELHLGSLINQLVRVYGNTSELKRKGVETQAVYEAAIADARRTVSQIMDKYTNLNGKQIWCEKSVYTINFIDLVRETFPEARYLCLYRNSMDFLNSAIETASTDPTGQAYGFAPYFARCPESRIDALIDYWHALTSTIFRFEQTYQNKCFRIKYEDIVLRPNETLVPLFQFLGLSWNQTLTESVFSTYHDIGPGDPKIVLTDRIQTDCVGKGAKIPKTQISSDRLLKMNSLLQKLNYSAV